MPGHTQMALRQKKKGLCLEETEWERAEATWDGRSSAVEVPETTQNVTAFEREFSNFAQAVAGYTLYGPKNAVSLTNSPL